LVILSGSIAHATPTSLMFSLAYKGFRAFFYELRVSLRRGEIFNRNLQHPLLVAFYANLPWPPTPQSIPLASSIAVHEPFSTNTANMFTTANLPSIATAEFMDAGEWVGYYYCGPSERDGSDRFGVPIRGIKFTTVLDEADSSVLVFRSNGGHHDKMRIFDIRGRLYTSFCKVDLVKWSTSALGSLIAFLAVLTPFGIIGHISEVPSGYLPDFWI